MTLLYFQLRVLNSVLIGSANSAGYQLILRMPLSRNALQRAQAEKFLLKVFKRLVFDEI